MAETIDEVAQHLETMKRSTELSIAEAGEIIEWAEQRLEQLGSSGQAEGEMGQAVALLKDRSEGLAEALSQINHAVEGTQQVAELVARS